MSRLHQEPGVKLNLNNDALQVPEDSTWLSTLVNSPGFLGSSTYRTMAVHSSSQAKKAGITSTREKKKWADCVPLAVRRRVRSLFRTMQRCCWPRGGGGTQSDSSRGVGCTILFPQLLPSPSVPAPSTTSWSTRDYRPFRSPRISPQKTKCLWMRLLLSMHKPITSLASLCQCPPCPG